jgi:stage IV sporulation protein FB
MFSDGRFYLGHLGKTPVYAMPEALLNFLLVWMWSDQTASGYVLALMAFLTVLLIHEGGHAVMARIMGMHGISITIAAFGGFCSYGGDRHPGRQLPIILAGCAANLLTAALIWGINSEFIPLSSLDPTISKFLSITLVISLILGLFNLLPIYPLDGGQATLAISQILTRRELTSRKITLFLSVAATATVLPVLYHFNMLSIFTVMILGMLLLVAYRDLR